MKKGWLLLGAITSLGAPVAAVISCSNNGANNNGASKDNDSSDAKVNNDNNSASTNNPAGNDSAKTKETSALAVVPSVVYYKSAQVLKKDDSWWIIDEINYTNTTSAGHGRLFYKNMQKQNGKYKRLTLDDWYYAYDTKIDEMFNDPNHEYASGAPQAYSSGTGKYDQIFRRGRNELLSKTGENNNGLNGLYSGAVFWIDGRSKKYDYSTIIPYNGVPVELLNAKGIPYKKPSNNWEHVSPWSKAAEAHGWKGAARKNRTGNRKIDLAGSDLHNLRPSIGYPFNVPRSNLPFGMVPGDNHRHPGVDFELGSSAFGLKVCEPRVSVRGDIARILLYMHDRYHITYDIDYYRMLLLWAQMDPVTEEEKALDLRIAKVMGFSNDYVTGVKQLPYDAEVEQMVIAANNS